MKKRKYTVTDLLKDPHFVKWAKGDSDSEMVYLRKWMEENPNNKEIVNQAKSIVISSPFKIGLPLSEKEKVVLHRKILDNIPSSYHTSSSAYDTKKLWSIISVAAVIIMALLIGFQDNLKDFAGELLGHYELITHKNEAGKRSVIHLNDGTKITLNAGSSISHTKRFGSKRQVELVGEAFFEVAEDINRPFSVLTGGIRTTVHGTTFNVRYYQGEDISVALVSGKVKVTSDKMEANLTPGNKAVYTSTTETMSIDKFDRKKELSWKDNIVYFDGATFPEVVKVLSRWYGVQFEYNKIPNHWNIKGEFENQSLEDILNVLQLLENISYKRENDTIYLDIP